MNQVFPEIAITADARQVGGSHYRDMQIQPWAAMEAWMTPEQFEGYLRGNALKYLARYPDKHGLEDLKKAEHYLQKQGCSHCACRFDCVLLDGQSIEWVRDAFSAV